MAANNKIFRARCNNSGVIITKYAQSVDRNFNLIKKPKSNNPLSKRLSATQNRRTELLAYARELRDCPTRKQQWWSRKNSSTPSSRLHKWKWSKVSGKIQTSIQRIFRSQERNFMYQRIATEEYSRKAKATCRGHVASRLCRKLKLVLKELSCGLQCSKR